jgi:hypothetical protein
MFQAMPIPYVEPVDISNVVLFLASDESRYLTGQQIRVDAGSLLKFTQGRPDERSANPLRAARFNRRECVGPTDE